MQVTLNFNLNNSAFDDDSTVARKFVLEPSDLALQLTDAGAAETDDGDWMSLWEDLEEHGTIDIAGVGDETSGDAINHTFVESSEMDADQAEAVVTGFLKWFTDRGVTTIETIPEDI